MQQIERFELIPAVKSVSDQLRLIPENIFDIHWLFKCQVKILVVTDSLSGGFGETAGFHLGQVLSIINDDPWSHINFNITKAHRQSTSDPDAIENIRFDSHDLTQYSQIWLFGINREGNVSSLPDAELKALTEFMDSGGEKYRVLDQCEDGTTQILGQMVNQ